MTSTVRGESRAVILPVPARVVIIYRANIITSVSEDVQKLAASLAVSKQENW